MVKVTEGNGAAPNEGTAPGGAESKVDSSKDITASPEIQARARIRTIIECALTGGVGVDVESQPINIERVLVRHRFGYLDSPRSVAAAGMAFSRPDLAAFALGGGPGPIAGVIFADGTATSAGRWATARILYAFLDRQLDLGGNWVLLDPGEGHAPAQMFAAELFLPAAELARAYRAARDAGASDREAVESLAEIYCEAPGAIAERIAELEIV